LIALIDALSSALSLDASQVLFLRAEGLELMLLTLKEAKYAARGALRVLDAALVANGANAERFADLRGFKTLFPLLGGAPPPPPSFAKGRGEREAAQRAHDAHVVGILGTLFYQLEGEHRQRLLGKFAEEGGAKIETLLAMRGAYETHVGAAEAAAARAVAADVDDGDDDDDDDERPSAEDRLYLARLDAGLTTLQLIDTLLGFLVTSRAKPLRVGVLQGLYVQVRARLLMASECF
jgi:beta-catenin-like protein 1